MLKQLFAFVFLVSILFAQNSTLNTQNETPTFTQAELKWMREHPVIRFTGDPDWLPFEAFDDGKYIGIVAEYLKLVDDYLPLEIKVIPSTSWSDSVNMAETNQVDMLSETTDSKLSSELIFTKAYIENPIVIVMKNSDIYIDSVDDIKGKTIAILKDYGYTSKIKQKYPDMVFFEVDNIKDALLGVSTGRYDALIADLGLCSYSIATMGINNVNIVGRTEFTTQIGFGVRKDYEELVGILNKTIEAIGKNRVQKIMNNWNVQELGNLIDYKLILQIILGTLIIATLLSYWAYTLKKEIKKRKLAEEELKKQNKKISDSIAYASLIQTAMLPKESKASGFFNDFFLIWEPKDVVGGDLYIYTQLRNENESLFILADCTGHGVPGAFVTMLVKAIERNITTQILNSNEDVSPSAILQIFNKQIKSTLNQETKQSKSNVGFDGAVIYFDKNRQLIRYAGAQVDMFYFNKNQELQTIKSDRQSIGHISSKLDFEYKDTELDMQDITEIFISTDGYLDQNGGAKSLSFGKKRFCELLIKHHKENMNEIKNILLESLQEWQKDEERNDDISVIGVRL